jgi:acetoin utilization deacetylase AcuC-like enzyme
VRVVASDRHRGHAPRAEIEASGLQDPFECPERADLIRASLDADPRFEIVEPTDHGIEPIRAVHDPGLVDFLERAWRDYQVLHPGTHDVVPDQFALAGLTSGMPDVAGGNSIDVELGRWCFETTTPLTEGTHGAARSAVDVALSALAHVLDGAVSAYGLCRPPGHHAPRELYGGYCFFNNAAIAAQRAVAGAGAKVAILDVDYHHGNGTQQIFYGRADVVYASIHADPDRAYPYISGRVDEIGRGPGRGATHNVPLPPDIDDDDYLDAIRPAIDAIEAHGCDLLIVSLGVDTHVDDPMADLAVTTAGFGRQATAISELGLPTVVLQEGGYDLTSIGSNVVSFLGAMV